MWIKSEEERSTMGTALLVIVYLTNGLSGANMSVTQFDVPGTQVFSSNSACQVAKAAVLAQAAVANMKITAVCMDLGQ
jgi:hypothetical protein